MIKPTEIRQSALLFCIVLLLGACQTPEKPAQTTASKPRPVKMHTVSAGSTTQSINLPAVIEAIDQSQLSFQVNGVLTKLELSKGAAVKKGEVLATLDQREFRNALNRAKADYDLAKSNYQRAQTLAGQNAIAQAEIDERRANFDNSKARLDSARKNLDDSVLRAPYDAVVADFHVESFETIKPDTLIVTLQTQGLNYAVAQVPASVVIRANQITAVSTFIRLDAAPDTPLEAKMEDYASLSDPVTQTFEARFSFANEAELNILPGMTATLEGQYTLKSSLENNGIDIPISAVLSNTDKTFVWVVKENNTVSRREVKIAVDTKGRPLVTAGLEQGEVIIAAGGHYLTEGEEVREYKR